MNKKNATGAAIVQIQGNIRNLPKGQRMALEPRHYSAKVTLARVSGITADYVTNTFHFTHPAEATALSISDLKDRIVDFYNAGQAAASGLKVAGTIGSSISRAANAHKIEIKNHGDLSAPVAFLWSIDAVNAATFTGTAPPAEVAVCASFKSDTDGSTPIERRRGRLYIGPMGGNLSVGANNETILNSLIPPIYNSAMNALKLSTGHAASAGFQWCVWSPTNLIAYPVTSGWTDTSFDIQRRRGIKAGGKLSWS